MSNEGNALPGPATGLVRQCKAASLLWGDRRPGVHVGAVHAYYDEGAWHYVRPADVDLVTRVGKQVQLVYVEEVP